MSSGLIWPVCKLSSEHFALESREGLASSFVCACIGEDKPAQNSNKVLYGALQLPALCKGRVRCRHVVSLRQSTSEAVFIVLEVKRFFQTPPSNIALSSAGPADRTLAQQVVDHDGELISFGCLAERLPVVQGCIHTYRHRWLHVSQGLGCGPVRAVGAADQTEGKKRARWPLAEMCWQRIACLVAGLRC
jgi:hypothetical protein